MHEVRTHLQLAHELDDLHHRFGKPIIITDLVDGHFPRSGYDVQGSFGFL
jgi:hypothetical protein